MRMRKNARSSRRWPITSAKLGRPLAEGPLEQKIDDSSAILQEVVASCAEPDGEFLVPLSEERFSSLQKAVWTKMEAA